MSRHDGRHYTMVKGAEEAMNAFKLEVARDLGLLDQADLDTTNTFKRLTTEQVGLIGGTMMRRIQKRMGNPATL